MSLRDYFAGQALAAQLSNTDVLKALHKADPKNPARLAALAAYENADAMLKARES